VLYLVLSPEFDMTAFSCSLTFTYLFVLPVCITFVDFIFSEQTVNPWTWAQ